MSKLRSDLKIGELATEQWEHQIPSVTRLYQELKEKHDRAWLRSQGGETGGESSPEPA